MRPHRLILAITGLLVCTGSVVADDRDEWDRGRRGGDHRGFDEDRREWERESYKRFEERRREDRRRYEQSWRQDDRRRGDGRDYFRDRRDGGYTANYGSPGAERYRTPPSPYLTPPPGYGSPRTTFDYPRLGRSGPPLPGLDPYGYGPGYPPRVTNHEVLRPRFDPVPDAQRQVIELSDALFGQTDSYMRDFASTAGAVPEGPQFLAEAQALNAAAARFREMAAGGAGPRRLSAELGNVEATYSPLAVRTDRVSQGRAGPNIQRVHAMGDVIQQLRQFLPFP